MTRSIRSAPALKPTAILTALAALATLSACIDREAGESGAFAERFTITAEGGSRPTVAIDPSDGTIYVAWVGTHSGTSDVYLSRLDPGADYLIPPVRVNDLPGDAAPHDQAPPRVGVGPDGAVYVVWQNNTSIPGRRFPASDLRFARSTDRGLTFEPAITVNDDAGGPPASHTFHDMAVADDGTLVVSWIDSRASDQNGPDIRIARSIDGGRSFEPSRVVDREACPCCRTALTLAPDGAALIAWRKVFAGEVRDIVVARAEPGPAPSRTERNDDASTNDLVAAHPRIHPPVRVHHDGWRFDACPHAGPALLANHDGAVHIAWYTGAEGRAGLYLASSDDGGFTFGAPTTILSANLLPPSQLAIAPAPSGGLWIAWEDRRGVERMVRTSTFDRGVIRESLLVVAGSSPDLAAGDGVAALAWLDGESVHLRVAR